MEASPFAPYPIAARISYPATGGGRPWAGKRLGHGAYIDNLIPFPPRVKRPPLVSTGPRAP
jgi:hypothetical protein